MKCTQCGGTKFIKTKFISQAKIVDIKPQGCARILTIDDSKQVLGYYVDINYCSDGGNLFYTSGDCECYVCEKCGHIELFSKSFVEKHLKQKAIDDAEALRNKEENERLTHNYKELVYFTNKLEKEIKRLNKVVLDENISVKEHKKAQESLLWANRYIGTCKNLVENWNKGKLKDTLTYEEYWLNIKQESLKIFGDNF